MTKVSVIIPSYNHGQFVVCAVESALAQTHPQVEIIVVDDGSTDDTRLRLSAYKDKIHYIYQPNKGLSAARNTGILAATGAYWMFLDADDWIHPRKLELQSHFLDSQPQYGLVYSAWNYVEEKTGQVLAQVRPDVHGDVLKKLLLRNFFFPPGAALVRRLCLDQAGLFDTSLTAAEDMDMWVRIAAAGYAFGYIDHPLFYYRVVRGSMSKNLANQSRNEFARLDKFFARPDLDADIRQLKDCAYGVIHFEYCTKYFRAGQVEQAQDHLRHAVALCPSLAADQNWILEWLAGFALAPQTHDPEALISLIFNNLPEEAAFLRPLRRRALGRYHAAAIFSEYRNRHFSGIPAHILPAIGGNPAILLNKGFWSILLQALLSPFRPTLAEKSELGPN